MRISGALPMRAVLVFLTVLHIALDTDADGRFLDAIRDVDRLESIIIAERPSFTTPRGVTGITVPHHLLAADLIARGFWAASGNDYDRVVIISPDHFRAVAGRFATTRSDIETAYGTLRVDNDATRALLAHSDIFEEIEDVSREHGLLAVAPFIKRFFPKAEVVAVLASISTSEADWRQAANVIEPLFDARTLIVQSTDYSHYLPLSMAVQRDQETLSMIAARDGTGIAELVQPDHLDSKAAQSIQLILQKEVAGAHPVIIANRNSAEYSQLESLTTSYVVTVFVRDAVEGSRLRYTDQSIIYFGGDTLLGRYLTPALIDEASSAKLTAIIRDRTRGAPLIINLEGVLLDGPVVGLTGPSHLMLSGLAGPLLKQFGVVAASLANNHSHDFGQMGFDETRRNLISLGIAPLVHGEVIDLGAIRVIPLNFVRGRLTPANHLATYDDLAFVCDIAAAPPLVAFVHWGEEYTGDPGSGERYASQRLLECGISVIVGHHSHVASTRIESVAGGELQLLFSLGNLAFDQIAARSSGALIELRVFGQRTVATRLIPIPNLFEAVRARGAGEGPGNVSP